MDLIRAFQIFYYVVLRQKEKALSCTHNSKASDNEETKRIETVIIAIQKQIVTVIETTLPQLEAHVIRFSEDIKYTLIAFTDEVFINLNWEGNSIWKLYLLENKLFQSEIAGDKVFNLIDNLLANSQVEDLAWLYLMILSLGFKGKYKDTNTNAINTYKEKLYTVIRHNNNELFYPGRAYLLPHCYEYTAIEIKNHNLPDTQYWLYVILIVLGLYILISYIIWYDITHDLNVLIKKLCYYE